MPMYEYSCHECREPRSSRLESLADPANMDGRDESDPRSLMKNMGEEPREDVGDMDALLDPLDKHDEGIDHSDSF